MNGDIDFSRYDLINYSMKLLQDKTITMNDINEIDYKLGQQILTTTYELRQQIDEQNEMMRAFAGNKTDVNSPSRIHKTTTTRHRR